MTDEPERGAPEGNQNAVKHGLYAESDNMREHLSSREETMLVDIAQDLLDRFPEDAHIGAYERMSVRNIALDTIKRFRSNEYIIANDMSADDSKAADRINRVYSRIVSDTTSELEKLGLLQEGPEIRKAEASESWMDAISDAHDDAE